MMKKIYPFEDKMTADEWESFSSATHVRRYESGELVHQPMHRCEGMVYIVNGSLRIYILSDDGREISLYRLKKGEICVLSASCVIDAISFSVFIEAETDTELLLTDAGALRALTENNIYLKSFAQDIALQRFSDIMWVMQQVLFFSVDRRLAMYLIRENGDEHGKVIKTTHEKMASSIGSAREVVSRMLKRFAEDGLIRISRGEIAITDLKGLRMIAE